MSQENVEIVKAAIEAWNREDWDTALQNAAPGFEVDMSRAVGPVSGVLDLAQLRLVLVDFAEHFESVRIEPHEFIEAGDLVVVPWTLHVRGRGANVSDLAPLYLHGNPIAPALVVELLRDYDPRKGRSDA